MKILITGGSGFIGTNLVDRIIKLGHQLLNLDIQQPKINSHFPFWISCDLLNEKKLSEVVKEFDPTVVIHLAARTDMNGKTLEDYAANFEGTNNLITALRMTNVEKVIFTSTQFVHQYQGIPVNYDDYAPHTFYGESKVAMEKIIKQTNPPFVWTIIRPTNIWGPWHPRYPYEFWKTLSKGHYLHPGKKIVSRSYGYVGNVVWQILQLLEKPKEKIDRKILYVGDLPLNLYEWVNYFSISITGKKVKVVPKFLIKVLAFLGDVLKYFDLVFPITSSRYKSMTTDNPAPMNEIFELVGNPPNDLGKGVQETTAWLKIQHPKLFDN